MSSGECFIMATLCAILSKQHEDQPKQVVAFGLLTLYWLIVGSFR